MKILNFGSLNLDYIYQLERFPKPGETMAVLEQKVVPGGKGLNQSIAMARAGVSVMHAGLVGQGGEMLRRVLEEGGVDVSLLRDTPTLQGNAVIQVNSAGENYILLFGGSNQAIDQAQVEETLAGFDAGDVLVLQNEVSCLRDMVELALARGMRVVLNPSPFHESLLSLPLGEFDWIFINEIEGQQMTGHTDPDEILSEIHSRYPKLKVVLTLGGDGSMCAVPGQSVVRQQIFPVKAIDTTAAGDTFSGFFIAGYAQGLPLKECLRRAAAAAAISVSRMGASVSIPTTAEVDSLLKNG